MEQPRRRYPQGIVRPQHGMDICIVNSGRILQEEGSYVTEYCSMQSLWLFYVMQSLGAVLECSVWVYKYCHFLLYG